MPLLHPAIREFHFLSGEDSMMKGIIRKGDSTTHGGTVLEGIPNFRVHGIPVAGAGHMVFCPKCKGTFPIIEGDSSFTAHGYSVALHGMRTACGAVLISSAGEFANVEHPRGTGTADVGGGRPRPDTDTYLTVGFDDRYVLLDSNTAQPLASTEYAIRRGSGEAEFGITDAEGRTHLLVANAQAEDVSIFVEG